MEKITKYIYSSNSEVAKNKIDKIKSFPIDVQRIHYFSLNPGYMYTYIQITEDDDKIVIVEKTKKLYFGNNGVYERLMNEDGVIYTKKGRTSSRLKFFYNTRKDKYSYLVKELAKYKDDVTALLLIGDKIFEYSILMTKGLMSSIISGKCKTIDECMKYYTTYSLRGIKIADRNKTNSVYNFYVATGNTYHGGLILRSAYNVNDLLDVYNKSIKNASLIKELNGKYQCLYQLESVIHALALKVDWLHIKDTESTSFYTKLKSQLVSKTELVSIWDKGKIINFNHPGIIPDNYHFNNPIDLPF